MRVIEKDGIKFIRGPSKYKYTAILPNRRRVNFGDKRYQQYKDKIGMYSYLDHRDLKRRALYRIRHAAITANGLRAIDVKYSPAWFSYHYLW